MDDRTVRPVVTSWEETRVRVPIKFLSWEDPARYCGWGTNLMIERSNPLCTLKEKQGHSNSSLETTKQNQNCHWDPDHSRAGWMIKCEKDKNDLQWMLQEMTKSILWYGECSCLQHWNRQYSWERITWTIVIPSRIRETSHWNKCSTYLQDKCLNKMRSLEWKQLVGKIIHGNICLWLVMKELSIFSAQRSTSLHILYCVFVRYTRIPYLTVHGKTDWDGSKVHQNTEILAEMTASHWNSSGIFSQDSIRCSSVKKSNIYCWD